MSESPLRTSEQRLQFCDEYFRAVQAPIVLQKTDYREYELPREIDKELTDRPFYWLWVEQTGQEVQPTILRLAFSTEALERENQRLHQEAWAAVNPDEMSHIDKMFFRPPTAELVSLGGFRLERILDSAERRGQFICAKPQGHKNKSIVPWVALNAVVSYACDLTEQEFVSLGLCLANGQIIDNFWPAIQRIPMEAATFEQVLRNSNTMRLETAVEKLQSYLEKKILRQPHDWAEEAQKRLKDDLNQLDLYYQSLLQNVSEEEQAMIETEHARKRNALTERAEPKIQIEITQLGIIGLIEVQSH